MSVRWWLASGAVVVVTALIFVSFWFLTGGGERGEANPVPSPTSAVPTAPPLSEEAAKSLAADVTSADEARVRKALAISDAQPLEAPAVAQLAAVAPLVIDVATFRDAQDGTATAKAQAGGPTPRDVDAPPRPARGRLEDQHHRGGPVTTFRKLLVPLVLPVLLASTITPASAVRDDCGDWRTAEGQSATRRPVVLVHGWTGGPMTDTANGLAARLGDRVSTFTFDYGRRSLHWASDNQIAGCLSRYVDSVSKDHKGVGGDGKVVVVAHSMGGLALRYALQGKGDTVPNIITLGTPNLGSPWGATWMADQIHTAKAGGKDQPPLEHKAALCLGPHDKGSTLPQGCQSDLPPWLPAGTGVTQVAGDVTVDRSLFGIKLYSLPLFSDGVVPVPSAHGYYTSGPGGESPVDGARLTTVTESCRVDHGLMHTKHAIEVPAGMALDFVTLQDLQSDTLSPATGWYMILATLAASCSHMNHTGDAPTLDRVAAAVTGAVDGLAQPIPVNPNDYRLAGSPNEVYYFSSPSKNFSCGIINLQLSAGCHGKTSPVPPRPDRCSTHISWGSGLFVDSNGKTDFICTGGVIYSNGFGREDPVLPYGRSLTAGDFTCVSKETGIRCTHKPTGHGFRIAAGSNEQF
jgi:hypothetical protein